MNQDIQRIFAFKLIGVSILAVGAWYTIVAPQVKRQRDIEQVHAAQLDEIKQGEGAIEQHAARLQASVDQMSRFRKELAVQLDVDQSFNIHKRLQDNAESCNLTVSRIEPLRSNVVKRTDEMGQNEIKLETSEFAIECEGTFNEIVQYLHTLSSGPTMTKVNTLRIIPVSSEHARMILQVSIYRLIETPEAFSASLNPSSAQIADTGDTNAEI